jgi:hypothetical protein
MNQIIDPGKGASDATVLQRKDRSKTLLSLATEFVVVFVAVFVGYLADSYREEAAEREREIQYAVRLVRDLKKDSASLANLIEVNKNKQVQISRFLQLADLDFSRAENLKLFYRAAFETEIYYVQVYKGNQPTIYQLKSTGDLRIMQSQNVADSISSYDLSINYLNEMEGYYRLNSRETWKLLAQVSTNVSRAFNFSDKTFEPVPLTSDRSKLSEFFNMSFDLQQTVVDYTQFAEVHRARATRLIRYLEEVYRLDEE